MRKSHGIFGFILVTAFFTALFGLRQTAVSQAADPIRGDSNSDKRLDIADAIFLLNYIFSGGPAPKCLPAANANADLRLDISDAITILTYLFSNPVPLQPLSEADIEECGQIDPPPVTVVRQGSLTDVGEPGHGISGTAEELSDGTIRISNFYYDGTGTPRVLVMLTKDSGYENVGHVISTDLLLRGQPYSNETVTYAIPPDVTGADFNYVAIWCDSLPLTYAFARL